MSQVQNIAKYDEKNLQSNDSNRFSDCEQIVDTLVNEGLPKAFCPDTYITRIAKAFNITTQEARTCLKLAVKQLEAAEKPKEEKVEEKLYAQSGYFYPSSSSSQKNATKTIDGMDSLSSLGAYNRLMFGLR